MPQQLLSPYEPTTLTQNTSYTLPAVLCSVTATAACETSTNGSSWVPFISGTETGAAFIRSAGVGTVVTCKPVMSGVGGEGALPTGPIDTFLVGKGVGTTPVFDGEPHLSGTSRLWIGGAYYEQNRIGLGTVETLSRDGANGVFVINNANGQVLIPERALSTILAPNASQVGALANISDSTVNTIGSTVAGGGSFHVMARWNGTVWKVIALG